MYLFSAFMDVLISIPILEMSEQTLLDLQRPIDEILLALEST